MHFVISGTWGPTDPTRAMLPFIFAASAVQDGDTVTLMLFHDAVFMGITPASLLLRSSPPLAGASVLSASRFEPLVPFPWHHRLGSRVPYKSPVELRAAYMPDAAWAVSGHPPS
jgi:hypothetical protein